MDIIEDARGIVSVEELAEALNQTKGTSAHPWQAGHVLVRRVRLFIDLTASDRLAARLLGLSEEQGRAHNENHSDFMVAGSLAVRHIDGRGWVPVEEA